MKQIVDWHQYWSRPENPGFHENRVNKYLEKYLESFHLEPGDTVFVPLCGKAVDMLWLSQQGLRVIAVELSEHAVCSFFKESGLEFSREESAAFKLYRSDMITIYNGNYIDLAAPDLVDCKLVYDRAALVAIEVQNRALYCQHMLQIVPHRTPMLLIALEYDQSAMKGPPFSVPVSEIKRYYQTDYRFSVLESEELIEKEPRWRGRGLDSFRDTALMLSPA